MLPLSDIDLPPGWPAAAAAALAADGAILVLGGPDSGKSTFCRYVLNQALAAGKPAACLDGDLGQSHLGPPAALGLSFYPPCAPDDAGLFPETLYFIGQTSPPGKMLELVVGLGRLADYARSRGHRRLLVNTSGFISGPQAFRLKLAKAETLAPSLVIGLQSHRELEPILAPLRQFCPRVLDLPVSSQARARLYAERRLYRQDRFAAYFAGARAVPIPLDEAVWLGFPFGQGTPLAAEQQQKLANLLGTQVWHAEKAAGVSLVIVNRHLSEAEIALAGPELGEPGVSWVNWENLELRLVGLLDASLLTLALGLLLPSPWERRQINIHTPLPSRLLAQVKFVRLGKIRLDLDGQELPHP
jgi:polynucleotide 5'-hydroxyl-kinase GRC3/NOL9